MPAAAEADNPFGEDPATSAQLKRLRKPAAPPNFKPLEELTKTIKTQADIKGFILASKAKSVSAPKLHGGEKAIRKALQQTADLDLVETPLKDVIDYLSYKYHIPVRLDSSALKEAGVDESVPITCKISGVPLRSALGIILDEIQLKSVIHNDVLLLTTPAKAESDEYMETKCYDVTDLVAVGNDHELQNPLDPFPPRALEYQQMPAGMGGMGGGMSGVLIPATAGPVGFLNSSPTNKVLIAQRGKLANMVGMGGGPAGYSPSPVQFNFQPLEDLITNTVATKTWADNGGTGTISQYPPTTLVISQTQEVHAQIKALFAALRARRQAPPVMSVELHWLWLDGRQRDRLLAGREKLSDGQHGLTVDAERLRLIADEVPALHGQVACMNGMATTLAAGDRRTIIVSGIPVVGGDGIGYQPVIALPNVGVTARVRPLCVPGTETVTLDVQSVITRWIYARPPAIVGGEWPTGTTVPNGSPFSAPTPPQKPVTPGQPAPASGGGMGGGFFQMGLSTPATGAQASTSSPAVAAMEKHSSQGGSAACPIDLPVLPTQQIGTVLPVPLGKPVVVGCVTFAAEGESGLGAAKAGAVEVYLIATTRIVKKAKP